MASLYGEAFSDQTARYRMNATENRLANQYLDAVRQTLSDRDLASSYVLDFGAGEGHMARAMIARGIEVVAVEPFGGSELADVGVRVFSDVDGLTLARPLDGVVMTEVVEHLRQPLHVLAAIRASMAPGGWLLITCPNAESLAARLLGERWRQLSNPTHLTLYTRASLAALLQRAGFAPVVELSGVIRFHSNPARHLVQRQLQLLQLDGNVRLMAFNSSARLSYDRPGQSLAKGTDGA